MALVTENLYVSGSVSALYVTGVAEFSGSLVSLSGGDFRVETISEDEALFVDSSANKLYINKGEAAFETIIGNTSDEALRIDAEE